ncbi:MAG: hypothetical protein DLD55_02090 [candidate division SR1 bacterium]|nr:MAG: hypothetical protein DLD55_02090 [candidate division SR1 bacterium]
MIATKGKLPLEFLYTRAYETLSGARSVEYQLKKKVGNIGDIYTVLVGRAIRFSSDFLLIMGEGISVIVFLFWNIPYVSFKKEKKSDFFFLFCNA